MTKHIVVTGATGKQGGATVKALLAKGHKVSMTTRDPKSHAAKNWQRQGVELIKADFAQRASLVQAFKDKDAVYAMTTPFEAGMEAEVQQGFNLIDAAKEVDVSHFIFGSVASANLNTGIPHFESKYKIEQYLQNSGLVFTISAPVFFMENMIEGWMLPGLKEGKLSLAMPSNLQLQQIATENIGQVVAQLVDEKDSVLGERIEMAGDELSGEQAAEWLSKASGKKIQFESFSPDLLAEQSNDLAIMFRWFESVGYSINIAELRNRFPEIPWLTFDAWAAQKNWKELLS